MRQKEYLQKLRQASSIASGDGSVGERVIKEEVNQRGGAEALTLLIPMSEALCKYFGRLPDRTDRMDENGYHHVIIYCVFEDCPFRHQAANSYLRRRPYLLLCYADA